MNKTSFFNLFLGLQFLVLKTQANPYTLEQSLTGKETVSLSSGPYLLEAGWEDWSSSAEISLNPYLNFTPVNSYILLKTDLATGENVVMIEQGNEFTPGWKRAGWFGIYFAQFFPWVYHQNLGWVHINQRSNGDVWLHHDRLGWTWTNPTHFPFLYIKKRNEWSYVKTDSSQPILYDFGRNEWFSLKRKYNISAFSNPVDGGKITGTGEFYRWDRITLVADSFNEYVFKEWNGDMRATEAIIEIEVMDDLNIVAEFIPREILETNTPVTFDSIEDAYNSINKLSEKEKQQALAELLLTGESKTFNLSIKTN